MRLFFRRTRYSSQGRKEEEGATRESWKTIPGLKVRQPPDLFLAGTNNDHLCSIKSNFVQSTETERTFGPSWNLLRARTPSLGSICSRIIECQTDIRKSLRTWVRDPIFFLVCDVVGRCCSRRGDAGIRDHGQLDGRHQLLGRVLRVQPRGLLRGGRQRVQGNTNTRSENTQYPVLYLYVDYFFLQKKTESSMCVFTTHPQERGRKAVDAYSYAGTYFYTTASTHFCIFTAWSCLLWTCKNNNMYNDGLFAFLPTHFTYCLTDLSF